MSLRDWNHGPRGLSGIARSYRSIVSLRDREADCTDYKTAPAIEKGIFPGFSRGPCLKKIFGSEQGFLICLVS